MTCPCDVCTNCLILLQAGHNLVCDQHKTVLNMRAKRKRKDSEEEGDYQPEVCFGMVSGSPTNTIFLSPQVDFLQLQMNTLRRYKRHYKLQLKPGTNKVQLVEVSVGYLSTSGSLVCDQFEC